MRPNLAEKITSSTQEPKKKKEEDEPYNRITLVTNRCILRLAVHGDHTTFAFVFKWLGMQTIETSGFKYVGVSRLSHIMCISSNMKSNKIVVPSWNSTRR